MSFVEAITTCLRKYAVFTGRARPAELWWFVLLMALAVSLGAGIDAVLHTQGWGYGLFATVFFLVLALPMVAVQARRLHDIGLSAWWLLLGIVPCGNIALILYLLRDGQGDNRFGPATVPTA